MGAPSGSGSPHLPPRLTRFFGRQSESVELEELVPQTSLVTLTGAPGCGKTRLGIELGARLAHQFPDGVWLVELAPITDPDSVAHTVGAVLGVAEKAGRPTAETLTEALAGADLLLVLDNCEHVIDAAALLARRLVADCPGVHVLATSRVALGVPGEQVWRVPPLAAEFAVELFTDRAGLVAGGQPSGDADGALVAQICDRLDGLPLAIELAAAWTRVLSLPQILDRVDTSIPTLRTGMRDVAPRQETVEATVDWSYRFLVPAEQRLFDRLSVFAGGFDLEAADAVAAPDDVLQGLTTLVDHSLVGAEPPADGGMRYRMLEPVRQCGAACLAGRGESEMIRERHAEHYLGVARRADRMIRGNERVAALGRLAEEEGNLLAALDWARARRPELALGLCAALARFWELRGRVNDGRAWLDQMLAVETPDRRLRATALARAGRLAWRQRDYERARALLDESVAIERALGDQVAVARRLRSLALVALTEGDTDAAIALCEQSMEVFRSHGDEQGLAWALEYLGWAHYVGSDVAAGNELMREAMAVNRAVGDPALTADALLGLAYGAHEAGDRDAQRRHLTAALAAAREAGGIVGEPDWLWATTALAANEGRYRAALRLAGGADAVSRTGGANLNEQFMLHLYPLLERARREVGAARADGLMADGARMSIDELIAEAMAEPGEPDDPLSPREHEIVALVAQGRTNGEIADELFISRRTVESHVDHVKQKLGMSSRNEVMAWWLRQPGANA
jgi:predicted ATPase/DNA-binding CsgD family transcriptional regulator